MSLPSQSNYNIKEMLPTSYTIKTYVHWDTLVTEEPCLNEADKIYVTMEDI